MTDLITVKAVDEDRRVKLWERHPSHPNGEIFISGNGRTVKVAHTTEVAKRIRTGVLVQVPDVQARPVLSEESIQQKAAPKKQPKAGESEQPKVDEVKA